MKDYYFTYVWQFVKLAVAILALILGVVGKLRYEDDGLVNGSDMRYLLSAVFAFMICRFFELVAHRLNIMWEYPHRFYPVSVHLLGDLGVYTLECMIIVGISISLIDHAVMTDYDLATVVLLYGLYASVAAFRNLIGSFYEFGWYGSAKVSSIDVMNGVDDDDAIKEYQATSSLIFKRNDSGFKMSDINTMNGYIVSGYNRNYSQMFDITRLILAICSFMAYPHLKDGKIGEIDELFKVMTIIAAVYTGIYFLTHIILYFKLKKKFGMINSFFKFTLRMIVIMKTGASIIFCLSIGLLWLTAAHIEHESVLLFDYFIGFSCVLVVVSIVMVWHMYLIVRFMKGVMVASAEEGV